MFGWLLTALLALLRWLFSPIPLTLVALLAAGVYYFITKDFGFWKSRGVPGPEPCFPWGNAFGPPFISPIAEFEDWLYNKHGGKKFIGYFEVNRPVFFAGDPDLIRAITIKDFEHFTNQRDQAGADVLNESVFALKGAEWKHTRALMTPTFSASKLKAMHQVTLDNADHLAKYVQQEMAERGEVDMKDMFGRFTMDNIAACAFGVECNTFANPKNKFVTYALKFFDVSFISIMHFLADGMFPKKLMQYIPDPAQAPSDFFSDVVNKTMAHREKQPTATRDFLQMLMDSKDKDGKRLLSNSSILAQSVLFFIAGYDTTATLLTFAAYCLAQSPEIQQRVQEEIDEAVAKHGGLTYDAVHEMTYMDRVLWETLRMYPPVTRMERMCTKDYTVPGTDIHIPVGTLVAMPVFMQHRDPEYYPDPLRFDPDRFLPEEKEKRHPCTFVPFGSGPRNCIAMRFALFEAKVALAAILAETTLKPTPTTPPHPLPVDKKAFLLTPEGRKLPLRAVARSEDD